MRVLAVVTVVVAALCAAAPSARANTIVSTPGCPNAVRWELLAEVHRSDQFRTLPAQKLTEIVSRLTTFAGWVGDFTACAAAVRVTVVDDPSPASTLAAIGPHEAWDAVLLMRPSQGEGWVGRTDFVNAEFAIEAGGQPYETTLAHEWLHLVEHFYPAAPWPDAIAGEDAIHEQAAWGYPLTYDGTKAYMRDLLSANVAGGRGIRASDWRTVPLTHVAVPDLPNAVSVEAVTVLPDAGGGELTATGPNAAEPAPSVPEATTPVLAPTVRRGRVTVDAQGRALLTVLCPVAGPCAARRITLRARVGRASYLVWRSGKVLGAGARWDAPVTLPAALRAAVRRARSRGVRATVSPGGGAALTLVRR